MNSAETDRKIRSLEDIVSRILQRLDFLEERPPSDSRRSERIPVWTHPYWGRLPHGEGGVVRRGTGSLFTCYHEGDIVVEHKEIGNHSLLLDVHLCLPNGLDVWLTLNQFEKLREYLGR